jgi:2-oxoglutarate dehydrogenase complex dehydrogenase (E1) component-like enzyme
MGAWNFVDRRIEKVLKGLDIKAKRPDYVGREEAASPATGLAKVISSSRKRWCRPRGLSASACSG